MTTEEKEELEAFADAIEPVENNFLHPDESQVGKRLDQYLCTCYPDLSRSYVQKLISQGLVLINGKPAKKNGIKLALGMELTVTIPEPEALDVVPENIPLDVLYEDEDVILVNKPKGMVVHPAAGHISGTLVNALLYHCQNSLSGINGVLRPGIVHRIDRDTTGVIIACKNDKAHECIAAQLKEHSVTRRYRAIVCGHPEPEGTINAPIGRDPKDRKRMAINERNGKHAITHWTVLEEYRGYALVECRLETGRTHQIRVHMASIGHPLLGDTVYGFKKQPYATEGQVLHAGILGFRHPTDGRYVEVTAPLPSYFTELIDKLRRLS